MKRSEAMDRLSQFIKAFEYAPGYLNTQGFEVILMDFIEYELNLCPKYRSGWEEEGEVVDVQKEE